jgi:hypothetical protein
MPLGILLLFPHRMLSGREGFAKRADEGELAAIWELLAPREATGTNLPIIACPEVTSAYIHCQ